MLNRPNFLLPVPLPHHVSARVMHHTRGLHVALPGVRQLTRCIMRPRVPARQASVLLEELGVPYELHAISLSKNEQKEDWFLKINPNGRIPAMTDGDVRVFESGALVACRDTANLAGGFRDPMERGLLLPPLGC